MEEKVLATHARVAVTVEPKGAVVKVAGLPTSLSHTTPLTLYLPPGQHQLELTHEGFAAMILVVSVDKGQRIDVQRTLVPAEPKESSVAAPEPVKPSPPPAPQPTAPAPALPPPPRESSPVLAVLGWSMAGLGVVAIGAGVGFVVAAGHTVDELDELQQGGLDEASLSRDAELRGTLRDRQAAAAGFFAGGGALALGGALVLLLQPEGPLDVTPTVGLGYVGVRGSF